METIRSCDDSWLEAYQLYLTTDHWCHLRQCAFSVHGAKCAACGTLLNLHVHHINYRHLIDCTVDDLLVLCEECHDDVHRAKKWRPFSKQNDAIETLNLLKTFWVKHGKIVLPPSVDEQKSLKRGTLKTEKRHRNQIRLILDGFRKQEINRQSVKHAIEQLSKLLTEL